MSDNKIYLTPRSPATTVRDPLTGTPLPVAGDWKPRSSYWLRRLRDKDVVESKPPKAAAAVATPAKGEDK